MYQSCSWTASTTSLNLIIQDVDRFNALKSTIRQNCHHSYEKGGKWSRIPCFNLLIVPLSNRKTTFGARAMILLKTDIDKALSIKTFQGQQQDCICLDSVMRIQLSDVVAAQWVMYSAINYLVASHWLSWACSLLVDSLEDCLVVGPCLGPVLLDGWKDLCLAGSDLKVLFRWSRSPQLLLRQAQRTTLEDFAGLVWTHLVEQIMLTTRDAMHKPGCQELPHILA